MGEPVGGDAGTIGRLGEVNAGMQWMIIPVGMAEDGEREMPRWIWWWEALRRWKEARLKDCGGTDGDRAELTKRSS